MTRRAPSGYALCTVPRCPYLGTQAGRCGKHHLEFRGLGQQTLRLEGRR
jgi:hypothetical protein